MRRILALVFFCFLAMYCGAHADMVEQYTTAGVDGCKDWMILHDDDLGCRTFWRPCGATSWSADPCGWESCNIHGNRPGSTTTPYTVTPQYGLVFGVATGTGGYFIPDGQPAQCGGYSSWTFVATGADAITCPPLMTQLNGN